MQSINNILMIDGAYLEIGNRFMKNSTGLSLDMSEEGVKRFKLVLESITSVKFTKMFYYTSEFNKSKPFEGTKFHNALKKNQIQIDIREFKNKTLFCKSKKCCYSQMPMSVPVQAEVDIAIATKSIDLAYRGELDTLVLVAGDRDFRDAIELITQKLNKKVWIISFENSTGAGLLEKCSVDCYTYFDSFWDTIATNDIQTESQMRDKKVNKYLGATEDVSKINEKKVKKKKKEKKRIETIAKSNIEVQDKNSYDSKIDNEYVYKEVKIKPESFNTLDHIALNKLLKLGFDRKEAEIALIQSNNSIERAIGQLVMK